VSEVKAGGLLQSRPSSALGLDMAEDIAYSTSSSTQDENIVMW